VRRHWVLVAVTMVATFAAAVAITPRQERYAAESTLFVGTPPGNLDPTSGEASSDRQLGLSYLAATFAERIDSYPVAERAVGGVDAQRDAEDLLDATEVTTTGTQLITVRVTDDEADVARALADAMSVGFIQELADQERTQQAATGAYDNGLTPVSLFAPARTPDAPEPTGLARNSMLGLLFGALVAAGLVVLLEYLDLTVRAADDAERRIGLPVLGVIPDTAAT
jgi:capsular polysaccharide biosynthesis protein